MLLHQDHPRIRGEKNMGIVKKLAEKGSPPHTRGKVNTFTGFCAGCRITPAYAGKSIVSPDRFALKGDHPRIRGEKAMERIFV